MAKGGKKRSPPRYPTDDAYRRSNIGFGVGRSVDGTPNRRRGKRPSFLLEILPDAQGISIQADETVEEEEEDQ